MAKVEAELAVLLSRTSRFPCHDSHQPFGFEIPAVLFSPAQLRQVHDDPQTFRPHREVTGEMRCVVLFKPDETPTGDEAAAIEAWAEPGEAGRLIGRAVHIWIHSSSQDAKIFSAFKKPLARGTNRTTTVLAAIAAKWAA